MFDRYLVDTLRDVLYGVAEGVPLRLDLHLPRNVVPRSAIVYFHGGGWRRGHRTDYEKTRAMELAARGYAVASVGYRLSGIARFPAQLEDARAAVAWVRTWAAELGIGSGKIGAWGASAGGNLAALLALGGSVHSPEVDAAVCWFAPLDLSTLAGGSPLERELQATSAVEALLGRAFDRSVGMCRAAEPLSLVTDRASPMLFMTGDRDRVVSESASKRMHDALVHCGVSSTCHIVGGAGHEDPIFDDPFIIEVVSAFFDRWLDGRRHALEH